MDPYPQPLNPEKEEDVEAAVDAATQHTEFGTKLN